MSEKAETLVSPSYLVEHLSLDDFYRWCRSPYLEEESNSEIFDFHIKEFEKGEYFEHCAILLEAKKEFEDGTIKLVPY